MKMDCDAFSYIKNRLIDILDGDTLKGNISELKYDNISVIPI